MKPITAIFENGVFRPTEKVDLPEGTVVRVVADEILVIRDMVPPGTSEGQIRIYENLARRFSSADSDAAKRHNEHQP